MKLLRKILFLILVLVILIILVTSFNFKTITASSNIDTKKPIRVGVLLYNFEDVYFSLLRKNLESIQKENENKVEFVFFDGKTNAATQHQVIDNMISDSFDLLLLNIVEPRESVVEDIINKAKLKNIPVVFFISTIPNLDILKTYPKAAYIFSDFKELPILEGQIIVDAWNKDKGSIDKNGDNKLQYIMLKGRASSALSDTRTKYAIEAINNAGIQTEELETVVTNWNRQIARDAITSLFLQYGPDIEAIITNDDSLAIGAIEALQKYGYNLGNKSKTIAVVGIDALPEVQELIRKGYMLGSVFHNPRTEAEAIYNIGMNLANGKNITEGTNYKIDPLGVMIPAEFKIYTIETIPKLPQ